MTKFDGNIRTTKVLSDDELRASLKGGWNKELPAIKDENDTLLVGHRRMKIALEEHIEPAVKVVTFGTGPEAEAERIRLANVSNIGGAPLTMEDRKRQAERLYKDGLTMEAIGRMLGVTHKTISKDLDGFVPEVQTPRPKGGRPKSKAKPEKRATSPSTDEAIASRFLDEGKTAPEIQREFHVSNTVVRRAVAKEEGRREAKVEPEIDPATLSMTAQNKLAIAIRQHQHALDLKFEQRVRDEVKKRVDEIILPHWKEKIEQSKQLYAHRKGLMDKAMFNRIRRGLHPDSRNSISDKLLAEAFDAFMGLEKYLLDEKDSPTDFGTLPSNLAEWDKMRRNQSAKRRNANGAPAK
jgi:transposase